MVRFMFVFQHLVLHNISLNPVEKDNKNSFVASKGRHVHALICLLSLPFICNPPIKQVKEAHCHSISPFQIESSYPQYIIQVYFPILCFLYVSYFVDTLQNVL